MKKVVIRPATAEDLLKCEQMLNSKEFITADGKMWTYDWLIQYLDDTFFLVAELNGEVLGCIVGERLIQRGSVIWLFVVDSKYRNMGIGSSLIEELERKAKIEKTVWILVYSDLHDSKTLDFYRNHEYVGGPNYIELIKYI